MITHLCDYCGGREEESTETFEHTDILLGTHVESIHLCLQCFPDAIKDLKNLGAKRQAVFKCQHRWGWNITGEHPVPPFLKCVSCGEEK